MSGYLGGGGGEGVVLRDRSGRDVDTTGVARLGSSVCLLLPLVLLLLCSIVSDPVVLVLHDCRYGRPLGALDKDDNA